jgi:hypothetical protein
MTHRATGGPGPHHMNVRPAKCAKKGYLNYGQLVIDNSMINGANQQITLALVPSGYSITKCLLSSNAKKL